MGMIINGHNYSPNTRTSLYNIGDIFYTTRTDNGLSGAVECNGLQYNFSDINGGDNNLKELLESGKIASVNISEFDSLVKETNGCSSFGYNKNTSQLKWWLWIQPTESGNDFLYTLSPEPKVGDLALNMYGFDVNISDTDTLQDYNEYKKTQKITFVGNAPEGTVSDGFDVSGEYCIMIDKSVFVFSKYQQTKEKPAYDFTNTFFKVPKKVNRILVRTQKPSYDNDYTWYNLYSDGWVEQGGRLASAGSATNIAITLPIEMKDSNYHKTKTLYGGVGTGQNFSWEKVSDMTSGQVDTTTIAHFYVTTNAATLGAFWQVIGYANSAEYTRDKWDYQNVKVERPMVQLFTDVLEEAIATCTSVLADVSTLKDSLSTFKFKKVEALPDNPDIDTVYFII